SLASEVERRLLPEPLRSRSSDATSDTDRRLLLLLGTERAAAPLPLPSRSRREDISVLSERYTELAVIQFCLLAFSAAFFFRWGFSAAEHSVWRGEEESTTRAHRPTQKLVQYNNNSSGCVGVLSE